MAVRQIRRRPGELRVFLLLTVAVGLLVFGVASTTVFTANRDARARVTIGADRVLRVAAPRTVDLAAEVARLDPSGRRAAAVYQGPLTANLPSGTLLDTTATATPSVLIADPARFAAVAFWRADFGSRARLADQLRPLTERPPQPVRIASPSLRVTMQAMVAATGPMAVAFGLTDSDGVPFSVRVADLPTSSGPSPARAQTTTVAVPRCTTGCLLRRLAVYPRTDDGILLQARLAVSRVDEIGPRGTTAVLPRLLASRWAALDSDAEGKPVEQIDASGAVLTVLMRPSSAPTNDGEGYGIVSALPARVPGLATASQVPPPGANRAVSLSIDGASDVPIVPTVVGVLPRAGDAGALIPRSWLAAARPFGFATLRPNQVWLSAQAPDDFARRLERAGVAVLDIQTASAQAGVLDDQGPSFAVRMLEFGAVASAALAVAGVATSLIVASRRRLYEIAALRSLGVGTRHVLASVVIEQGVIATVATLVGLAAGLAGARVALDKLPEFADSPAYPRLVVDLPVLVCVGLAVAVVAIVSLVVAIGAAALVRQASPSRLREAQQ